MSELLIDIGLCLFGALMFAAYALWSRRALKDGALYSRFGRKVYKKEEPTNFYCIYTAYWIGTYLVLPFFLYVAGLKSYQLIALILS